MLSPLLIPLALAAAGAQEPSPVGLGGDDVRAAHTLRITSGWPYTMTAEPRTLRAATALVLRVDPERARPRQVATQQLYVDATVLEIVARSPDHRCVVALAPREDLGAARIYWGSDELPERVDARAGEATLAAAKRAGVEAISTDAPHVARNVVQLDDHRTAQLYFEAMLIHCG
jgi:hypothetical protein